MVIRVAPLPRLILAVLWLAVCALCCSESGNPEEPGEAVAIPAAVLYQFGKLSADGDPLKTGDTAAGGAVVKTERKSLGNLQLQSAEARIVFLMREKSELRLTALRRGKITDVTPILREGRVLVQMEKLSGSERLFVYTPEARVTVQGTEFIVSARGGGESQVQVHSGVVGVRPQLEALESLPAAVLEQSQAAREIIAALDELETVVGPGQETLINVAHIRSVLGALPELEAQLKAVAVEVHTGAQAGRSSRDLAQLIDRRLAAPAANFARNLARERETARPAKTDIHAGERERMREDFRAMVSVDPAVFNDPQRLVSEIPEVSEKNFRKTFEETYEDGDASARPASTPQSTETQLQSLAKKLGGSVKVLVLQSGEEKRGVVVNQGEDYLLATTAGQKLYKRDEVREVRLR